MKYEKYLENEKNKKKTKIHRTIGTVSKSYSKSQKEEKLMIIIQFNDRFIEIVLQYKIIGYMKENGLVFFSFTF